MSPWTDSPNVAQRAVRGLIATRPVTWALSHTIHHLDGAVIRASGGRHTAASLLSGLPMIALTTTGAKSGEQRTVPLVGIPDGERLILIASNWGQTKHPAWYYNARANPAVSVMRGGQARPFIAREVTGQEREAMWRRAVTLYPGYASYAERCGDREIPVLVLEPSPK